jgi:hypothetical protein
LCLLDSFSSILAYLHNVARKNACEKSLQSSAITALSQFTTIAVAGHLMALIKMHVQKLRSISAPALRYGVRSYVIVSLPPAGQPAVLVLSDSEIVIAPTSGATISKTTVPFTVPAGRFRSVLTVWASFAMLWVALVVVQIFSGVARLRVHLLERCWSTSDRIGFLTLLDIVAPAMASLLVLSLIAIVAFFRLSGLFSRWVSFWCRRNVVLVLLCIARGFINFRRDLPLSTAWGTLINYALLLPLAVGCSDLLLMLRPHPVFVAMCRCFVFLQIATAAVAYVDTLALDSPCDTSNLLSGSNPSLSFLVSKVMNNLVLFFSLYFLGLLVTTKIFTGIKVPIIKFSNQGRFSSEGKPLPPRQISKL